MNTTETKSILEQFTVLERAVLYARVSGDDTRKEGRNIAGQLNMGREYCIQKGYRIVAELAEDEKKNTSGADWDLLKLNEALEMAGNGEFDVLIVRELDRFARDLAKQLVIENQFKSYGVRIEYVLGEYPDTPEGNLNKNIKAVIAEYERLKTRERMVRGKNQVALSGKVIASDRVPYGYRLSDDHTTFVICSEEAEIVELIFELYTQEGLSIRAIAARLSELKIPTAADKHSRIRKRREIGQWADVCCKLSLNVLLLITTTLCQEC
ncbi:MAG: recombinase family protein [Anaerolineae bacterium]